MTGQYGKQLLLFFKAPVTIYLNNWHDKSKLRPIMSGLHFFLFIHSLVCFLSYFCIVQVKNKVKLNHLNYVLCLKNNSLISYKLTLFYSSLSYFPLWTIVLLNQVKEVLKGKNENIISKV